MIPHVHVHRRGNHDRSSCSQIKGSQEVAGNALREVRQNVGSCGSNYESVNRLRHGNVFDGGIDVGGVLFPGRKHSRNHFFARECRECQWPDELLRRARHDDLHANTAVLQEAYYFGRLISRDPTRHSESNFHGY
jgi:hypothetical protein